MDTAGAHSNSVKTICIIGGGPAGLAALKVIADTPQFKAGLWRPVAFESRENVGGVWLPDLPDDNRPPATPLYDSLTTNLPHPVMAYSSFPFPPSTPLFPRASIVQDYLESYCNHFDLSSHIRLNTTVQSVRRNSSSWEVQVSTGQSFHFDLVIVANGHHRVPHIPNTPGLSEWIAKRRATHSAWYRNPRRFEKSSMLVVGAGPSGQDISTELCTVTDSVIHSVTGATPDNVGNIKRRGRAIEFKDNHEVCFEDGTIESGVDHCILATGYEMAFPFFQSEIIQVGHPPSFPPLPQTLFNSSDHVFPLARHIFPLQTEFPPSSLAFMGIPKMVSPFPLLEAQARAIVELFARPDSLNMAQELAAIRKRYEELECRLGHDLQQIGKNWHTFSGHEQFVYRDQLYEFAESDPSKRIVTQQWEKDVYEGKHVLRAAWNDLVRKGAADKWVDGVGEGGQGEWVDLMRRMLDQ